MIPELEKIRNRRAYKVKIGGEDAVVRPMSLGEIDRIEKLPDALTTPFMIGCCLLKDDRSPAFTFPSQADWDKAQQDLKAAEVKDGPKTIDEWFAKLVRAQLVDADIGTDVISDIQRAVGRVATGDAEEVLKN